jgi:hypothetical protein
MSGLRRACSSALGLFATLLVVSIISPSGAHATSIAETLSARVARVSPLQHPAVAGVKPHLAVQPGDRSDEGDDHHAYGAVVACAAVLSVHSPSSPIDPESPAQAPRRVLHRAPKTSPPGA